MQPVAATMVVKRFTYWHLMAENGPIASGWLVGKDEAVPVQREMELPKEVHPEEYVEARRRYVQLCNLQ